MPKMLDPTPAWLKPSGASVLDSPVTKALRTIASLLGANDPQSQALALMMPMVPAGQETVGPAGRAIQKVIKAFHGTSASEPFDRFKGDLAYFASDPREAEAYAKDAIIGGSRLQGPPRIIEAHMPDGQRRDITHVVNAALADGADVDEVIAHEAVKARHDGIDFLTFDHPSSYQQADMKAIVSLRPSAVSIEPNPFRAVPLADGRMQIVGPNGISAGIYEKHEVSEALRDLEFGFRKHRPVETGWSR